MVQPICNKGCEGKALYHLRLKIKWFSHLFSRLFSMIVMCIIDVLHLGIFLSPLHTLIFGIKEIQMNLFYSPWYRIHKSTSRLPYHWTQLISMKQNYFLFVMLLSSILLELFVNPIRWHLLVIMKWHLRSYNANR